MPKYITDSLIELARVVLLAIIPVIMTSINAENGFIDINWQVVLAVGLLAVLRWLDKLVHLMGKEAQNKTMIKGITRF